MLQFKLLILLLSQFSTNTTLISAYPIPIYQHINTIVYESDTYYSTINSIPVVVLHGVASSASKMLLFSSWISETFNRTVFNLEIGNGYKTSLFMPPSQQLDQLCKTIYNIKSYQYIINVRVYYKRWKL